MIQNSETKFAAPPSPVVSGNASYRPTRAVIHLANIRANIENIRAHVGPNCRLWAVVKADAYGHGMIPVARTCLEAKAFGLAIATVDEAVELRPHFPGVPILLLGPSFPSDAETLLMNQIQTAVGDKDMAKALSQTAYKHHKPAMAHLKIDTGMGRFGFDAETVGRAANELATLPSLQWKGVFTHFAVSDSPKPEDIAYTKMQMKWFKRASQEFCSALPSNAETPMTHACNSGGILQHSEAFLDAVRPGVMLYGSLPDPACPASVHLYPGMTLKTRIVNIRHHPAGASLSYGRTYTCPGDRRIAILPIGYGDGYSRALSNHGEVVVRGRRAPIPGRVCMDQTLIDLTEIPEAEVGNEVILFGGSSGPDARPLLPVQEVASWMNTITYEVTCQVGRRVPRVYED